MGTGPAVIVTGGAGYIGSHTCKALHAAGFNPVTIDNLSTGHPWAVQWGPLEVGDIRDTDFVSDVMSRHKAGAVLHLAGLSLVAESARMLPSYYDCNVSGTIALVAAMSRCSIFKIIYSSSSAVYGVSADLPLTEDQPVNPISVYGRTKLAAENFLRDAARTVGLDVTILRYFNAAGASDDGEIGECHLPETHLVPRAILATLSQGEPLSIFGTDHPTPDGTCIRDYVHVEDVADAHVMTLQRSGHKTGSETYNLGSGAGISVWEVLNAVERILDKPVPVAVASRREGDPTAIYASTDKIQRDLGWMPHRSTIDRIVGSAIRWHRRAAAHQVRT
jgi:UDP-arabinose 4-epimerase